MAKTRNAILSQARAWIGRKESDGSHKVIIDTYNSHKPLARGYAVKYTDAWCATFVSACAVKTGMTDIIPTECSCYYMIEGLKRLGVWVENDAYVPSAGDIILYDWNDSGVGDNTGSPDHVGIVESVSGGIVTVIEGNYHDAVGRRKIAVNGRYIRGYGVPNYDKETQAQVTESVSVANTEMSNNKVLEWQKAMNIGFDYKDASGHTLKEGGLVEDGIFWNQCKAFAKSHLIKRDIAGCPTAVKWVQKQVGCDQDGIFGLGTHAYVVAYQRKNHLEPDGIVGLETVKAMLL